MLRFSKFSRPGESRIFILGCKAYKGFRFTNFEGSRYHRLKKLNLLGVLGLHKPYAPPKGYNKCGPLIGFFSVFHDGEGDESQATFQKNFISGSTMPQNI